MNKRTVLSVILASVLILGICVVPALAYFTAHVEAEGSIELGLGFETSIDEQVEGTTKTVTIANEEASNEACYVRVIIYSDGSVGAITPSGEGWSEGESDDYWYYDEILEPGEKTEPLTIDITPPAGAQAGDSFKVAVLYESTKVTYNADGTPANPIWNMSATVVD